jgi:hypothetical protein
VYKEFLGVEGSNKHISRRRSSSSSYSNVEVWIYDAKTLGYGSVDYQLKFVGTELVEIEEISPH